MKIPNDLKVFAAGTLMGGAEIGCALAWAVSCIAFYYLLGWLTGLGSASRVMLAFGYGVVTILPLTYLIEHFLIKRKYRIAYWFADKWNIPYDEL